ILWFILLPTLAWMQESGGYAVSGISPELLKNANSVIRNQDILLVVKSPGEAKLYEKLVVTLLNEKNDFEQLVLHVSPSRKVEKIKGNIYDGMGHLIRSIKKNEVREESAISSFSIYEDDKYHIMEAGYTEYPFTVEFEYSISITDLMFYPDWDIQELNTSVQNSSFTLDLPPGLGISYKALNTDIEPVEEMQNGRKILQWKATGLAAIPYEPYSPPSSGLLPHVLIAPHAFEIEKYTGSMESWDAYGKFMNKLLQGRYELSAHMKEKVAELTANADSDSAKIEALYRFIQQNLRYVSVQLGIGGYQPFPAQYVEEKKYGDCKAVSNFMKSLLTEAGIISYPVLIRSGELQYEITGDFAFPSFNHMILYVPSEDIWLECTSNTFPMNYVGASNAGRNVLLITEDGGKIGRTPEMLPAANLAWNKVTVALDGGGSAKVQVSSHLTGERQEWYRDAMANLSAGELQKAFQEASSLPGFKLETLKIEPSEERPSAEVNYSAQVAWFGSKAGKRLFVPVNVIDPFNDVPPAVEDRQHPVVSKEASVEEDRITLLLPHGYKVESLPSDDLIFDSEYGHYHLHAALEAGEIIIDRRFERLPVSLPASGYAIWRNFLKEIAKADAIKIVLVAE
ncbi:MAG: DUF3857 domain-containing protein, partial [Saprospiraceae bacterium]